MTIEGEAKASPLEVLHVTRDFPPAIRGGLSLMVARTLKATGAHLRARVVSFEGWRPAAGGGTAGSDVLEDQWGDISILRVRAGDGVSGIADWVRRSAVNVVHLHDPLLLDLVDRWGLPKPCPLLFTVHVLHAEQDRLRGVAHTHSRLAEMRAIRTADRTHALSASCADAILQHYPDVSRHLRVAPAGVDMGAARQAGEGVRGSQGEAPAGGRAAAPEIVHVGRFSDMKGLDTLLDALPRVLDAHPDALLRVIGGIPDSAASERRTRRRLEAMLAEGLKDRVIWEGWQSPEETLERIERAAVLVAPSRFETFGQAALEGVLSCVPVVATCTGRLADLAPLLADRVRFVPPDDAPALAHAIIAALSGPRRPSLPGADITSSLTWPGVVSDWLALYRDVAGCNRP